MVVGDNSELPFSHHNQTVYFGMQWFLPNLIYEHRSMSLFRQLGWHIHKYLKYLIHLQSSSYTIVNEKQTNWQLSKSTRRKCLLFSFLKKLCVDTFPKKWFTNIFILFTSWQMLCKYFVQLIELLIYCSFCFVQVWYGIFKATEAAMPNGKWGWWKNDVSLWKIKSQSHLNGNSINLLLY